MCTAPATTPHSASVTLPLGRHSMYRSCDDARAQHDVRVKRRVSGVQRLDLVCRAVWKGRCSRLGIEKSSNCCSEGPNERPNTCPNEQTPAGARHGRRVPDSGDTGDEDAPHAEGAAPIEASIFIFQKSLILAVGHVAGRSCHPGTGTITALAC